MIAAVYDWSGFYIGANGGWGSSRNSWDILPLVGGSFAEGSNNANGGTVGGQVGYRWQAGTWVFGVEAQGNWADFKGSNASLFNRVPQRVRRPTPSACSPVRLATLPTTSCCTSRAVRL